MSDSHDPQPHSPAQEEEAHEGPIKTSRQLIATVVASFVVPIVAIVLLVNFVDLGNRTGAGSDALSAQSVAARLKPVAVVEVRDAANPGPAHTGEQVFQAQCSACHLVGALGSPKFGDATAWAPRIAKGYEALLTSALKGKGNMTPQGGGEFTDYEVGRAVVYMADHGGAKFADPPAPAAPAASGAAAAAPASAASAG